MMNPGLIWDVSLDNMVLYQRTDFMVLSVGLTWFTFKETSLPIMSIFINYALLHPNIFSRSWLQLLP